VRALKTTWKHSRPYICTFSTGVVTAALAFTTAFATSSDATLLGVVTAYVTLPFWKWCTSF
jgi:hypothetical protein